MKKLYTIAAALMLTPLITMGQDACTLVDVSSNGFENGNFMEAGGQLLANDFSVSANTANFALTTMSINILSQGGVASLDIIFHADANGNVGDEISSYPGLTPTSADTVGSAFGYDVQTLVFDFDTPIDFDGGATYWVQVIANPVVADSQVAWESTTASADGYSMAYDNGAGFWTLIVPQSEGVFTLSGDCTPITGCFAPEDVMITDATTESLDVEWTAAGDATQWVVEYGETGFTPGSGTEIIVDDTPGTTIEGLTSMTGYDIYVRSVCGEGDESTNVGPISTTTTDTYCAINPLSIEPITLVDFAGLSNTTTADPGATTGHEYFLDMQAMVQQGGTYPITVEGYTGGDYTNSYLLFVDWDQDGDFNLNEERYEIGMITSSTGEDGIQATADVFVPVDATLGETRMRVVKMYTFDDTYNPDACTDMSFGQIEDYMVQVDINTGIDFNEYNFTVGPNPTTDFIQFSSTANIQNMSIYSVLGQKLMDLQDLNQQSPKVDMSKFENGTYLIEVEINNEKKVFKVVKQ